MSRFAPLRSAARRLDAFEARHPALSLALFGIVAVPTLWACAIAFLVMFGDR